jgi:tetratricopeptide (TPR) repeat protein
LRTLKPFIEVVTGLLLPVLLTGCVSLPGGDPAAKSSESAVTDSRDTSDQKAPVTTGSGITSHPPADMPLPEVSSRVATEFEQAVALLQEDRYREAEALLLTITGEQPELAGPWINLGQIYVALGQPEEARQAFEAAVAANPYNCTAHNELGLLARVNGDFEAAERHYLNCIERVPDDRAAYLNLGILYELYLGRLPEALVSYRQYQSLGTEPDRQVEGWVVDLQRRLGS